MKYNVGKRERKIISYILREINRGHVLRINGLPLLYCDPEIINFDYTFVTGSNDLYFYVRDIKTSKTILFIPFKCIKEIYVKHEKIIV